MILKDWYRQNTAQETCCPLGTYYSNNIFSFTRFYFPVELYSEYDFDITLPHSNPISLRLDLHISVKVSMYAKMTGS